MRAPRDGTGRSLHFDELRSQLCLEVKFLFKWRVAFSEACVPLPGRVGPVVFSAREMRARRDSDLVFFCDGLRTLFLFVAKHCRWNGCSLFVLQNIARHCKTLFLFVFVLVFFAMDCGCRRCARNIANSAVISVSDFCARSGRSPTRASDSAFCDGL